MIEAAADKSTRVPEGRQWKGDAAEGPDAVSQTADGTWDAGEHPADCRALGAESCHE